MNGHQDTFTQAQCPNCGHGSAWQSHLGTPTADVFYCRPCGGAFEVPHESAEDLAVLWLDVGGEG